MPNMSGDKLATELMKIRPDIPVILFMSGYTDDAIVQHGVLGSGISFIEKPFNTRVLVNKVGALLRK